LETKTNFLNEIVENKQSLNECIENEKNKFVVSFNIQTNNKLTENLVSGSKFVEIHNIVEIHIVLKFKLDLLIFHQDTVKNRGGRIILEQSVYV